MKKKNRIFTFLIVLVILILCIGYTVKTFQNDTFYTIKIGEDILKYGVDMKDHFSFHGLAYTYPHWLYDVIIYIIYAFFGLGGIYITNIIFYFVLAILIYFLNKNLSKNNFISGAFAIICVILMPHFITARAQLITYILFVLELFFIEKYLETENKKYLICLPIISLLIVNMHCAVWIFFFILFIPCVAEKLVCLYKEKEIKIKKLCKKRGKLIPCEAEMNLFGKKIFIDNKKVKWLIFTIFICLLTGFITLNGATAFTYIINTMRGNTTDWISEHQPPILYYSHGLIFYMCLMYLVCLIRSKIRLRDIFLIVGLFILAISSYRHASFLFICGSFVFVRIFSEYLNKNNKGLSDMFVKVFTNKIVFVITVILSSLVSVSYYYGNKIYEQKYIDETRYPVEAANYILKNIDIKEMKIFNEYEYGSYLLFRDIPVFVDSRADLYTIPFSGFERDITEDYLNVTLNYEEIFEYYDITHVICYRYDEEFGTSVFYKILDLDSNYDILYEDEYFAIFERD